MDKQALYRNIPKVDVLLADAGIQKLIETYGKETVMEAIHAETDRLRGWIRNGVQKEEAEAAVQLTALTCAVEHAVLRMYAPNMHRVVNGTGTILHTNLGRAPLCAEHMQQAAELMAGYSNLEYDLESGARGERYAHFEELLCRITGAEAAMAVNNNAASVLLILNALASGGEVLVSRGELVEIGGKFRIPDVMVQSGALLREVGATNKTHPEDYERGITEETRAILKVHTSNYQIVGFSESVDLKTLAAIAQRHQLPVVEDLGSGVLINLEKYGLPHEPTVQDSVKGGADVICFSGDKLLGGPQAGIIIGKKKYIDRLKKSQLTRALRIDKFTAAVLELVLREYLSEDAAVKKIPVLRMLTKPFAEAAKDAVLFENLLKEKQLSANIALLECESQIGGGSLPLTRIPSMAVSIQPEKISLTQLQQRMHHLPLPVIGRVMQNRMLLDVRTIEREDFAVTAQQFAEHRIMEPAVDCGQGVR